MVKRNELNANKNNVYEEKTLNEIGFRPILPCQILPAELKSMLASRFLTTGRAVSSSIASAERSLRNVWCSSSTRSLVCSAIRKTNSKMADATSEVTKAQQMKVTESPSIFTKIINKEIPGKFLHEDDLCVALVDVNPQAPVHFLVVPRQQIPGISYAKDSDQALLGHLLLVARKVAEQQHLQDGYRIVINEGKNGCQSVPHLHIHVLGKRQLNWPPG
ncbi:putative Histidine triad nucleotide-binding protein 2, mitochondrial [Hypsibius exemplaris]|uniref:Histidine triad nucleotide-binding protein 2, mitochondrial n=1 Tax=Hypsibius exemplaris TaxID=2072580 RepID=A0A1W0WTT5_HYPEX|nr:putative Histidine triad nucleotide-binding protein 2, mitochondrial [Hypsibius exemplaris]